MWLLKVFGAKLCTVPVLCSQVSGITGAWQRQAENTSSPKWWLLLLLLPIPTADPPQVNMQPAKSSSSTLILITERWVKYFFLVPVPEQICLCPFWTVFATKIWSFLIIKKIVVIFQSCGAIIPEWENWKLIYWNFKDFKLITANP